MFETLLILAASGLALATLLYMARLMRYQLAAPRAANGVLAVACVTLGAAAVVGLRQVDSGALPTALPTAHQVLLWLAVAVAASGLVSELRGRWSMGGAVLAPMAAVMALVVFFRVVLPAAPATGEGLRAITVIHISATLVGFILFIPAFVLSVLYVGQAYRLKTKQITRASLPSLLSMERHGWRLLYLGFPLYTVGILLGVVWFDAGETMLQPRHVFAGISWFVFAFIIYRRLSTGWRGARAALSVNFAFIGTLGAVLMYSMR